MKKLFSERSKGGSLSALPGHQAMLHAEQTLGSVRNQKKGEKKYFQKFKIFFFLHKISKTRRARYGYLNRLSKGELRKSLAAQFGNKAVFCGCQVSPKVKKKTKKNESAQCCRSCRCQGPSDTTRPSTSSEEHQGEEDRDG